LDEYHSILSETSPALSHKTAMYTKSQLHKQVVLGENASCCQVTQTDTFAIWHSGGTSCGQKSLPTAT